MYKGRSAYLKETLSNTESNVCFLRLTLTLIMQHLVPALAKVPPESSSGWSLELLSSDHWSQAPVMQEPPLDDESHYCEFVSNLLSCEVLGNKGGKLCEECWERKYLNFSMSPSLCRQLTEVFAELRHISQKPAF